MSDIDSIAPNTYPSPVPGPVEEVPPEEEEHPPAEAPDTHHYEQWDDQRGTRIDTTR
ncbi:hypothetical protein [Sediminispirochaeta bajacaliforniensis]|uniref:hypothetical protein n=1 Tax=Sediminispirochaeta bajacaliforniensis TaxID=148 RepID=UPI000380E187|nr:hypothetical protein [Sediminispirochaeta bajacaliforniensis]